MKTIEFRVMIWLRSIREKHAAELKDKSVEDRVAHYRRKAQTVRGKPAKEKVVV